MTDTLPNPTRPITRERPPAHINSEGRSVTQFRIVTRHAAMCSCGDPITNPHNVDEHGERSPWFLTSNDARRAAEAHNRHVHR